MKIFIVTLFPEMFSNILNASILKRAQDKGKLHIELVDLRTFGLGKHKSVDDKPYGGGAGMVLRVDVLHSAIKYVKEKEFSTKVILLDPAGKKYEQQDAEDLSKLSSVALICGHYEGFDARVRKYIDLELSIGDFVLTGGEIPALAVIDSVARLIPGVLGKDESSVQESFSVSANGRILEHDQFTRPEEYDNAKVPEEFLSGNPKRVVEKRLESSIKNTKSKRPDLLT